MTPISTKVLFGHCYGRYAIAAVNVFNMEQVHGLFAAAQQAAAPIIVQITPAARNYAYARMMKAMVDAAADIYPEVVYAIHLDHGNEDHVFDAMDEGYTSVMIDASHDAFEQNVARTRAVKERAHAMNIVVEAELGVLGGVEDDMDIEASAARYTDPEQAARFVELTACDSLAVAVGTSHGAYKFSGGQGLQFHVLEKIRERLPGFPLVLHGASLVDPHDVERINLHGGKLQHGASGISREELQKAIRLGICKVNIATDLRLLWARVYREFFYEHPDQFDPVAPGRQYRNACANMLMERFELLGATGKAQQILETVL
ncbi:MAG TPA: class II fructose-bisphosphate aldolase [Phnomibacter sp.]|nr:class II fructose-bisphosphate aldolase [Phnomibacter sp.]